MTMTDYQVKFKGLSQGRVQADVIDEDGMIVDQIVDHSFMECYLRVSNEYPDAQWSPDE